MSAFAPPIVRSPSGQAIGSGAPFLNLTRQAAVQEIHAQASWLREFHSPTIPPSPIRHSTFAHVGQRLRTLLGFYSDTRTLDDAIEETMDTALGPLPWAVTRAIQRHTQRADAGPASILEIGAGQRLVPAGLKAIYGDTIRIAEVSPRFGRIDHPAIDWELAEVDIDRAILPPDTFELAYSLFGSFYGRDQLGIMQKVLDSLRLGGETLLMWKENRKHNHLSAQVRRRAAGFPDYGFDITAQHVSYFPKGHLQTTQYHVIWARKRTPTVDVRGAFAAVAHGDADDDQPSIHLSQDGPYFPSGWLMETDLRTIVADILTTASATLDVDMQDLYYRWTGMRADTEFPCVDYIINQISPRLREGEPLTCLVVAHVADALQLRAQNTTARQADSDDFEAYCRALESRSMAFHP